MSNEINYKTIGVHEVGGQIKEDGQYVCVPCGYQRELKKGSNFPSCLGCLKDGRRRFAKNLELWERLQEHDHKY